MKMLTVVFCVMSLLDSTHYGPSVDQRSAIMTASNVMPGGKGIKNGCPCFVEIRGTQGCALVGDPARAVGECRDVAMAQP